MVIAGDEFYATETTGNQALEEVAPVMHNSGCQVLFFRVRNPHPISVRTQAQQLRSREQGRLEDSVHTLAVPHL